MKQIKMITTTTKATTKDTNELEIFMKINNMTYNQIKKKQSIFDENFKKFAANQNEFNQLLISYIEEIKNENKIVQNDINILKKENKKMKKLFNSYSEFFKKTNY